MQLENDFVSTVKQKLTEYLRECTIAESQGLTISGEAWAYRRMLNFVNNLQPKQAAPAA